MNDIMWINVYIRVHKFHICVFFVDIKRIFFFHCNLKKPMYIARETILIRQSCLALLLMEIETIILSCSSRTEPD